MGMIRNSESYLMLYDGRLLPFGTGWMCHTCGSDHFLDIVPTKCEGYGGHLLSGFSVVCDCGACGSFSVTRRGALLTWNSLMKRLWEGGDNE